MRVAIDLLDFQAHSSREPHFEAWAVSRVSCRRQQAAKAVTKVGSHGPILEPKSQSTSTGEEWGWIVQ